MRAPKDTLFSYINCECIECCFYFKLVSQLYKVKILTFELKLVNKMLFRMVVNEEDVVNIMGGMEHAGGIKLNDHKRKLKNRYAFITCFYFNLFSKILKITIADTFLKFTSFWNLVKVINPDNMLWCLSILGLTLIMGHKIHMRAFYYTFLALNYWLTKFEPTYQDLITIS